MGFVINGRSYTGCSGDGYKEAAERLYRDGKTTFDPFGSNVDSLNARFIQEELDKMQYVRRNVR